MNLYTSLLQSVLEFRCVWQMLAIVQRSTANKYKIHGIISSLVNDHVAEFDSPV